MGNTQTEDQTLEDLWPNIPDHADGSLGTCAIVGNADNLSGKGWGTQIDAHDFVVRYNVEIKGFEKDVGTKRNGIWTKVRVFLRFFFVVFRPAAKTVT